MGELASKPSAKPNPKERVFAGRAGYGIYLRTLFTSTAMGVSVMASLTSNAAPAPEATFKVMSGMDYSPFMNGQQPGGVYPTDAAILQDLSRMTNITGEVRIYGIDHASGQTLWNIPALCTNVGLYCWVGEWLSGTPSVDGVTVTNMMALARSNYYTTKGFVIENEDLLTGAVPQSQIVAYMNQLKAVTSLPVTVSEPWAIWTNHAAYSQVIDNVRGPYVIHIHPYWEDQQASNAAAYVKQRFDQVHAMYPTNIIIIGETGWPTGGFGYDSGGNVEPGVPSEANQTLFLNQLIGWASTNLYATDGKNFTNRTVGWFFDYRDENWKTNLYLDGEGSVGGHWGLTYASDSESLTTNKPALSSALSRALTLNGMVVSNKNHTAAILLETSEGDSYNLQGATNLLKPNWVSITNFNGAAGTNVTWLQLPTTNNIFTNKSVFLRAEYNFK